MSDSVPEPSSGDDGLAPQVPDHDLVRPIGEGGFGQVWLAVNRATGHLRAVKLIPLHHAGTMARASRELTSIARLEENLRTQHPTLLSIHHVGKTADHLFYVMDAADDISGSAVSSDPEYQPATLQTRLQGGALAPSECLHFTQQLLAGLACLHESGMVHRDVKPANCLFVRGVLKLADFGLVTATGPDVSRVGTRKYMPPDGPMDARADVYAAGLVIYEMITGLPVGAFPRVGETTHQVARNPILAALNRIVLRACEPDPKERFRDAQEMSDALRRANWKIAARGRKLSRPIAQAVVSMVVAIGLLIVVFWPDRPRPNVPHAPPPETVHVNFITKPFKATVYLDGEIQRDAAGTPWLTPCGIPNLSPEAHHLAFKRQGFPDLEVGEVDFATEREIEVHWPSGP